MKITQSHLGSFVLTIIFVFCLLLIARESFADSDTDNSIQDGKVDVTYSAESLASYKVRRQSKSILFGLVVDSLDPDKFRSKIDNAGYRDLFGHSVISLLQVDLGTKYNFALGGVYASLLFGGGEVYDTQSGDPTTLSLRKKGVSVGFCMDNLFQEPYVAPYVSAQYFNFDWEEATKSYGSKHGSTAYTSAIQMGLLFQLNWLDPDAALTGQNSSGLNNTFLDLFASQYNASNGADDPNFQTDINFGFGLRLEY